MQAARGGRANTTPRDPCRSAPPWPSRVGARHSSAANSHDWLQKLLTLTSPGGPVSLKLSRNWMRTHNGGHSTGDEGITRGRERLPRSRWLREWLQKGWDRRLSRGPTDLDPHILAPQMPCSLRDSAGQPQESQHPTS